MAKRLFLLLIPILLCLVPEFLMATDSVELTRISDARTVETVVLPEPEPEPVAKVESQATVTPTASQPAMTARSTTAATPVAKAPVSGSAAVSAAPVVVNYTVTRYIGSAKEYNDTAYNLSYGDIYKFRKMIYGHNTGNLLGSLRSRYVGETITVTEGGVTKNYRVASVSTYTRDEVAKLMNKIANSAMGHDVALLTCAGNSLGNGDATHRLVVLADAL